MVIVTETETEDGDFQKSIQKKMFCILTRYASDF